MRTLISRHTQAETQYGTMNEVPERILGSDTMKMVNVQLISMSARRERLRRIIFARERA